MKDIPVEELASISPEIHQEAIRVGCTEVSITGRIWPGGQTAGTVQDAARFVEFSWLRAAVLGGRAIFEESDPAAYVSLLNAYGLGDEPAPEGATAERKPAPPEKVDLSAEVLPTTLRELTRQADAAGLSVGELLDLHFAAS